jgi:hypothetical protein
MNRPILVLLMLLTTISFKCFAQDKEENKEKQVSGLVENKEFRFVAQSMQPLRGSSRQLTSGYDVKITRDSINSQLPYAGRAQSASLDPSEQGLTFISTDFDISVGPMKKEKWDIVLKPKDTREVREMRMTVFSNGAADLQVSSNNRDPVSFRGYIEPVKAD